MPGFLDAKTSDIDAARRRGGVRAKAVVDGLEVDQASALHAVGFSWSAVAFGGDVRDDSPAISEEGRRK